MDKELKALIVKYRVGPKYIAGIPSVGHLVRPNQLFKMGYKVLPFCHANIILFV